MDIPGFIVGFREGLEAFLLIVIALRYLKTLDKSKGLQRFVWGGAALGVGLSVLCGAVLNIVFENVSRIAKVWESVFSLALVLLITSLIFWMIKHSSDMKAYVRKRIDASFTGLSLTVFSAILILREGAEVVLFTVAGDYELTSVFIGIAVALGLTVLMYFSLLKVKLKVLFSITLVYLILQAGYLLGYSLHEGLSAMKGLNLSEDHALYIKAFDLSSGILNHKDGAIGLPLNVLVGWYSKPEWLPFILQYSYSVGIFTYWAKRR
jgi:high-affinity iron transporter